LKGRENSFAVKNPKARTTISTLDRLPKWEQ
jgi:hypothetical protein